MNDKEINVTIGLLVCIIWGLFILIIPLYTIVNPIYSNCLYAATITMLLGTLSMVYQLSKK